MTKIHKGWESTVPCILHLLIQSILPVRTLSSGNLLIVFRRFRIQGTVLTSGTFKAHVWLQGTYLPSLLDCRTALAKADGSLER